MNKNHRWNTKHYEDYISMLDRIDLHKLYPSESWCLYRLIGSSKTVMDLGCGNGAMGSISKKINGKITYLGIDHQDNLIKEANKRFNFANYISSDVTTFLQKNKKKFDTVMAWSVIKSFPNWKWIIKKMIKSSNKYVVFDQRVANIDIEKFDKKILSATYGGIEGPLLCIGYKKLLNFLLSQKKYLNKIEIMAYQSNWGRNIKYKLKKETFVVTVVLHKKTKKDSKFKGVYEQLPLNLKK